MKKYKINEIFCSIQGEGAWTGTPVIFIRFSGCNLACSFCDTRHEEGREMSLSDILTEIRDVKPTVVCLTGGEPGLQVDSELIDALHRQGRTVHIETNGTCKLPEGIDWVTVSPKTPKIVLDKANEIKVVYQGQNVTSWEGFPAIFHFLQPCSGKNIQQVVGYVLQHPQWSLSLQTHKLINVQ